MRCQVVYWLTLLSLACWATNASSAPPRALLGIWKCETGGAVYVVGHRDNRIQVLSIIDDDGEFFPVLDSHWDGHWLRFRYRVPSTGYVVIEHARPQGGRTLTGNYRSLAPDGSSFRGDDSWTLVRRHPPPR